MFDETQVTDDIRSVSLADVTVQSSRGYGGRSHYLISLIVVCSRSDWLTSGLVGAALVIELLTALEQGS